MTGFYRVAAAVPELRLADVAYNLEQMHRLYCEALSQGAAVILFPELSLTGSRCGDLFFQQKLLDASRSAMEEFASESGECTAVFGLPLAVGGAIYNVCAVARNGRLLGIVPLAPNRSRAFSALPAEVTTLCEVPAGNDLLFEGNVNFSVGKVNGDADFLLLPGAETELPGSAALRRKMAECFTAENGTALIRAESGWGESTTDSITSGQALIAACGEIAAEIPPLHRTTELLFADLDCDRLRARRRRMGNSGSVCRPVPLGAVAEANDLAYAKLSRFPFLPEAEEKRREICGETLAIQAAGLAHRVECCHAKKMVLGISGGLDSTLALLVLRRTCLLLDRPMSDILAVTMPGFGTTERTKNNALRLAELIGAEIRDISIAAACRQHFADLNHDENIRDSVYENSQARERTQILMDLANAENGLVIGTGDLSELALGWCTYNGDQMAMYGVNASIPKTMIRFLMEYEISELPEAAVILKDVINTPVSPELLPADENGEPGQKTENILGAYELHDFYIWHFLESGASPEKLLAMAETVFAGDYAPEELRRVLGILMRRFFSQQFKRSAAPDGIQAGPFSLSPRGSWCMPSDASGALWQLESEMR